MRGLESLGVKADQCGSFLIPVIMSKLPADVRLYVALVSTKDVWEINELLKVIRGEVEARELTETMKVHDNKGTDIVHSRKKSHPPSTASSLVMKSGICFAFRKGNHYLSACEEVKDVQKRKDIMRAVSRFFLGANQCSSQRKCTSCGRSHHQAICENSATQVGSETPVTTSNVEPNSTSESTARVESPQGVTTTTVRSNVKALL